MGLHFFVTGFFLKSIAADNIGGRIDPFWQGQGPDGLSAIEHWLVALLYYCQIYGDFAGYSLMALGMARLLGYRLPANFRVPMIAASLQEFWRRWHITLSRWLREYLYIPLGGSRTSQARTSINILVTMLLGGLWHGAGLTFLIWGAMHGAGLVSERLLGLSRVRAFQGHWLAWYAVTQVWVTVAWVFFRSPDLRFSLHYLAQMVNLAGAGAWLVRSEILFALVFALPVVVHHGAALLLPRLPRRFLGGALGLATAIMLLVCLVVTAPSKTFLYFKF